MNYIYKCTRNYFLMKYKKFYKQLSRVSGFFYKYEAHTLYLKKGDTLTKQQKNNIKNYWKRYLKNIDLNYHTYYINRTGKYDVRYIPDDIFAKYIDGHLNNREIENGIADKNYFDLYLNVDNLPKTYVHLINGIYTDSNYNIISQKHAADILFKSKKFICKPSMISYGGKSVELLKNNSKSEIIKYLKSLNRKNFIFQEVIEQSKETAKLHPKSLNTIRIMTLLIEDKVYPLESSFRMGVGASIVDNASAGGIYCGINKDGTLTKFGYDAVGNKHLRHPDGGKFEECIIPNFEEVRKLVVKSAQKFPHFRLIGWDVAIDKNNKPIIIEANLTMSGLDVIQTICGPVFGEHTEKVLNEVFLEDKEEEIFIDIDQYI